MNYLNFYIKDITNTFDFYYYLPKEDKIDLPDINSCVKYGQIETYFKDLYLTINNKKAYKNYYNLNKDDELKITINKLHNILSAFESWFDINFPKFKSDTNENDRILKDKVIKFIEDCIIEEEELNEKISNTFKNTRNRIAHGNMKNEILFSDIDVVAYVIVERLVQCLVFYKANVDMNKIKEIVDDRF